MGTRTFSFRPWNCLFECCGHFDTKTTTWTEKHKESLFLCFARLFMKTGIQCRWQLGELGASCTAAGDIAMRQRSHGQNSFLISVIRSFGRIDFQSRQTSFLWLPRLLHWYVYTWFWRVSLARPKREGLVCLWMTLPGTGNATSRLFF